MDLTWVSRSVVGKGDGFTMCARPSEMKAIFEGEVETPDCTTLAYALRAGMNRSGSGMVLSPNGCHI